MPRIFVSIGSNIDREHNITAALAALDRALGPLAVSTLYESKAMGFDGDPFYNLVAGLESDQTLMQINAILNDIETQQGRVRGEKRFGPRSIDLDLLLYNDHVQHDDGLDLPRGEILEYAFVLGPLAELAPNQIHPETGESFAQMWAAFEGDKSVIWPAPFQIDRNKQEIL